MQEISNKTLTILLISAIVVSIGGSLISLNKLSGIKPGAAGFASANKTVGNISLTISDVNWINFSQARCNWGTGYATRTCKLNTSGYINTSGCSTTFQACTEALELRNIGNNNCSLNITFKNSSAFVGGTNAHLFFKMLNGTRTGSTATAGCVLSTNMSKFVNDWVEVTHEGWSNITCDRFYYGVSANTISLHVQVSFDGTAPLGLKRNTVIATGKPKI
ncbi:MAG: hypothetical protein V1837_03120 [Candidatus Woesearchaeota archaeon]